jgi:hypothetical protein
MGWPARADGADVVATSSGADAERRRGEQAEV